MIMMNGKTDYEIIYNFVDGIICQFMLVHHPTDSIIQLTPGLQMQNLHNLFKA